MVSLPERFDQFMTLAFSARILPFDEKAAKLYGKIMSERWKMSRPMSSPDGQIAAIARAHGFAVATRNVKDFADCQIEFINLFKR